MFKRSLLILVIISLCTSCSFAQGERSEIEQNWPQWRGPYANGIAPGGNPPVEWSENRNVKWKIEIPGKGHATPIVWGDIMYVSTAMEVEGQDTPAAAQQQEGGRGMRNTRTTKMHKFAVIAINRLTGRTVWQTVVTEEVPQEGTHELGSWASNSPVTDGEHIYAYFGSRGLYCLDMNGEVKWDRDFGQMEKRMEFGEGSSPALHRNKVIVLWDQEGDSFISAIDKNTGEDIWKVNRNEGTSWSTPFIVERNGQTQVITVASKFVRSYDVATGELIWRCSGLTSNLIPVPVIADDILYVMSGHRGFALIAIKLSEAKGDITGGDAILWTRDKDTPYTPSPLLIDEKLYILRSNRGMLTCLNAKDGSEYYVAQRLEGINDLYTSPVAVNDRIYILGNNGTMVVVKGGTQFEIIATNTLDDRFNASPVVIGDTLYLRGYNYLYCISQQ